MFDGNHRPRKAINLGGRTNRRVNTTAVTTPITTTTSTTTTTNTTTTISSNKAFILEQSRLLREVRRCQLQQQSSAVCIQRYWRGCYKRWTLCKETIMTPLQLSLWLSLRKSKTMKLNPDTVERILSLQGKTALTNQRIASAIILDLKNATITEARQLIALWNHCTTENLQYKDYHQLLITWKAWNQSSESHIHNTLLEWMFRFSTNRTQPLLIATLLTSELNNKYHTLLPQWIPTLVHTLTSENCMDIEHDIDDAKAILQGNEVTALLQVIAVSKHHHYDFWAFMQYILQQRTDILWYLTFHINGQHITVDDTDNDNNDDDDDSETIGSQHTVIVTPSTKQRCAQWTKQDIQTIPKLDRLYRNQIISTLQLHNQKQLSQANAKEMDHLVKQLTQPSLWVSVLATDEPKTKVIVVTLLASLLRTCSGYQTTSTTIPFLSHLAFDQTFLTQLWCHLQTNNNNNNNNSHDDAAAMIVFCDVFAHHLISLSDSQFLSNFTSWSHHTTNHILVNDVIVKLRIILHDLYWQRPVLANDINVNNNNARLLLSGTKLWNSIYERWCRLVRVAPFCHESMWWFPKLISREDVHVDVDALADAFKDAKMGRILTCIPQALPFERRVTMFHALLKADKANTQNDTADFRRVMEQGGDMMLLGRERVEIHRDSMYDDSMNQLNQLGHRLKRKVQVTFVNQHGTHEAGIDGGGVFKEFLDDLIKEAFDPDSNRKTTLFTITPLQTLTVNMETTDQFDVLRHYEFLGRVLGKAIYESILVEPQFCLPFLNQLLGKQNSLEDLKNLDDEFYNNLMKLRTMSASDIETLALSFELQLGPSSRTIPLLPGGASKSVTRDNVIHYIHLLAHYRLNVVTASQTRAFLRGFRDLIPASWVRLFSAHELQTLVSGDDTVQGIDVASLKQAMQYAGGYHPSQQLMEWFWEVIDELTPDQQRKFLKFMTSCSRQPLLGFQSLAPAPCIQQIRLPDDMFDDLMTVEKLTPLPTSATCMNLLKLPNYRSKKLLRKKLIHSIESGAGFELT